MEGNKIKDSLSRKVFNVCNVILMLILIALTVIPVLNTIAISFSSNAASMTPEVKLWPTEFSLSGYITLFKFVKILTPLMNTIFVTAIGTFLHVFISAITGYALAKEDFIGKKIFIGFILVTMMVPLQNIMIPMYMLFKNLHLIDSLWAIMLSGLVTAYSVTLLKTFFEEIPKSLGEAAIIDGASEMQMFIKIFLPLAKPGIATIVLFQIIEKWNIFLEPILYINDPNKYTLQVALKALVINSDGAAGGSEMIMKNTQMAGIVITIIPLLIIYPVIQKFFIKGLTSGAVKG